MTGKKITLFLKEHEFFKNVIYLINGINKFCGYYTISLFYTLCT